MNGPQVSVIVANFNGAAYLDQAIESVKAQTLSSWEMIVVDDASTDRSLEIAKGAGASDARIRVLSQPVNAGPAAARNRALDEARGEWIAVFDSDDAMAPDRLARLLHRAAGDGARIVADNQLICSSGLEPQRRYLSPNAAGAVNAADLALFIDSSRLYSPHPDLGFLKPLIHRSLLAQTGARYNETLRVGEDFHFLLSLLAGGERVSIEPQPLYFYRKHPASVSHRLGADTISRMIAADEAFGRKPALPADAVQALKRRIEGLKSWAAYERTIAEIKRGRPLTVLRLLAGRPQALPLLLRPAVDRLGRALARVRQTVPPGFGRRRLRPLAKA